MTVRRWTATGALVAGAAFVAAAACTAFSDVPPPTAAEAAGGDGGPSGDDAGASSLRAPGLLAFDDAMKLCTKLAECTGLGVGITLSYRVPLTEPNTSYCVTELSSTIEPGRPGRQRLEATLRQIAEAATCADANRLVHVEPIFAGTGDPRCAYDAVAGQPLSTCIDDKTVLHCTSPGGAGYVKHCGVAWSDPEERCTTWDASAGGVGVDCAMGLGCTDPGCVGPAFDVCEPSNAVRIVRRRQDCAALGMQCTVSQAGDIGCSLDGVNVLVRNDGYFGAYCEGSRLLSAQGEYVARFECADAGARCVDQGYGALCALPTDACTPFDEDVNRCSGNVLSLCVAGNRRTFDCAALGKTCRESSSPDEYRAACR